MLPNLNRVRVLRFPLDAIATDWLAYHDGDPTTTPAPTHDAVLRQPSLPDDATVLYSRIDTDPMFAECARLRSHIALLRDALVTAGLPVPDVPMPEMQRQVASLVVAVESAKWKPVAVGDEPEHHEPVDWQHFGWRRSEEQP